MCPLYLLIDKRLNFLLLLTFILLLPVLIFGFKPTEFIRLVFDEFLNLIGKLSDLVFSVRETVFGLYMGVSFSIQLFS